jgi:hypothetical protein
MVKPIGLFPSSCLHSTLISFDGMLLRLDIDELICHQIIISVFAKIIILFFPFVFGAFYVFCSIFVYLAATHK